MVSPHGQVAARASADLEQVASDIRDVEAFLAGVAERLAALTDAQRERSSLLSEAFQVRETASARYQQARAFALYAAETEAAEEAESTLVELEQALEEAETHYRNVSAQIDEQSIQANSEHDAMMSQQREGQARLNALQQERAELAQVYAEARRKEGTELLQRFTSQAQEHLSARAEAQQVMDTHTQALDVLAAQAKETLAAWPDLLLAYQQAYVPVVDEATKRLEVALAIRKELRAWLTEQPTNWALNFPHRFFLLPATELDFRIMDMTSAEIQAALARHIEDARKQAR